MSDKLQVVKDKCTIGLSREDAESSSVENVEVRDLEQVCGGREARVTIRQILEAQPLNELRRMQVRVLGFSE